MLKFVLDIMALKRTLEFFVICFLLFQDPDVQVNENCVKCLTNGVGARGNLLYEFSLELNANIQPFVREVLHLSVLYFIFLLIYIFIFNFPRQVNTV